MARLGSESERHVERVRPVCIPGEREAAPIGWDRRRGYDCVGARRKKIVLAVVDLRREHDPHDAELGSDASDDPGAPPATSPESAVVTRIRNGAVTHPLQ